MSKTEKELAFLHDLYISTDWTERFADLIGKDFKADEFENILYVNAGTGNHALALEEKLDEDAEFVAVAQNVELRNIAQAKADIVKSNVIFADQLPDEVFDAVIADLSFIKPSELRDSMQKAAEHSRWQIAFLLPTSGSFGEIFSYLWQTFLELDWLDKGARIENLLSEIPTVSKVQEITKELGFTQTHAKTKSEVFEFENGAEFTDSPLVADFLFENWLGFLSEDEKARVLEKLAQIIDAEREDLTFRFAVKATLITGAKE